MPNPVPNVKLLNSKFTRTELLEKAGTFDFREARRRQGPVYEALIKELYEDRCTRLANQLRCFVAKEQELFAQNEVIHLVSDEPEFLFQLFDNFRTAELIKLNPQLQCDGLLLAVQLLYQCTFLVEKFAHLFYWLMVDVYDDLAIQMFSLKTENRGVQELIARFRYKYGKLLSKQGNHKKSINVLSIAQEMSNSELWIPDTYPESVTCTTLHEAISRELGATCLLYAKQLQRTDPAQAIRLANKSLVALARAGFQNNKELVFRAYMAKIDFLMQMLQYDKALQESAVVENYMQKDQSRELLEIKCELLMRKGICYYNTENRAKEALTALKRAFAMCMKYKFRSLEAELLLNIGKVYASATDAQYKAHLYFVAAKKCFAESNDSQSMRMTSYLIAQLQAEGLFPLLSLLVKSQTYCDFYQLRHWKNRCRPFWEERPSDNNALYDEVSALMMTSTTNLHRRFLEKDGYTSTGESGVEEISVDDDSVDSANNTEKETFERWSQEIISDVAESYGGKLEEECQVECNAISASSSTTTISSQDDSIYCLLKEG